MAGKVPSPVPRQLLADAGAVNNFLDGIFADTSSRLERAMAWGVLGAGKRLRGGLVLGAMRLALENRGEKRLSDGVRVAAALECLHAYSLIHDDLPSMDNAPLRRGKNACHIEFDEATAILAGDALQSLAFELLADKATHPDGTVRANLVLELAQASGAEGMAGGQMLDLEAERGSFTLAQIRAMQAMKTGALIRASVMCGGLVGNASEAMLAALGVYGEAIGRAFQIADDRLDRLSSIDALGKPTATDRTAGKATVVDNLGLDESLTEAQRLIDEAEDALSAQSPSPTQALDYMLDLAKFSISRNH